MKKIKRNKQKIYAAVGILGSLILLIINLFLRYKLIGMKFSITLITLSAPSIFFGYKSLRNSIRDSIYTENLNEETKLSNKVSSNLMGFCAYIGLIGTLFLMLIQQLADVVYSKISNIVSDEQAENIIMSISEYAKFPYFLYYVLLIVLPSLIFIFAILRRQINLKIYHILFTPLIINLIIIAIPSETLQLVNPYLGFILFFYLAFPMNKRSKIKEY